MGSSTYLFQKGGVPFLGERWIKSSERILERIKRIEEVEDKDRLDYVRDIRFLLSALHRSLVGWIQWVNNPDVMARFSREELDSIAKRISEFTRSFIEYDIEATKAGIEKNLEVRRRESGEEVFYI
ncbi:hypothetical protein DRO47_01430 [Candidatus Bathyarchaeota archaeon]|nr:MAG: hypothetical protein CP083_02150 [Candidatus Bathyarchaeota archaeon B24-2]RLI23123.1 MAG: hypothetical protein DRO47_01430 [Candidatus Bathyarchaeota archaeon]